jgi:hypothetical protein
MDKNVRAVTLVLLFVGSGGGNSLAVGVAGTFLFKLVPHLSQNTAFSETSFLQF